jgi:hypothetical protein
VLEVVDPLVPANHGRWVVAGADGRLTCEPTTVEADLHLDIRADRDRAARRSAHTQLAAAGLVHERRPGVAARLDRLLRVDVAPWHDYMF